MLVLQYVFPQSYAKNVKVYDVLLENMQWKPYSFILSLKNQQISFGKKWTLGRWQILGDGKWTFKEVSPSQCCFNQQGNCFNIDGLFTSISLLSHNKIYFPK